MNNVYNPREIYSIHGHGDMCYDNKVMMNAAHSDRPTHQTVVNIGAVSERDIQHSSKPKSSSKRTVSKRFRRSYIYNVVISVIVISVLIVVELGLVPGTKLGFICNDPTISHKYRGDTISPTVLLVGSAFGPLVVLLLAEVLVGCSLKRLTVREVWFFYKECLIGCSFVLLITEIAKIIVGEHRPHFFDVCEPDTNKNCINGTFVATYTCTSTKYSNYFLTDTSRSFPSGHSSVSVYVSLYTAYMVHRRIPSVITGILLKPFLVCVCLTWGLICSLSRIVDRRHHWWDVLAGTCLGALGACYTLRIIHRKLNAEQKPKTSTSTTTLLDVKNKDATSVIL